MFNAAAPPDRLLRHRPTPGWASAVVLFLLGLCLALSGEAQTHPEPRISLRPTSLDLPGPPSLILPADLDEDGRRDLVVAVAFTEWDQIGIEETAEMDDAGGLVEVLTIVPALTDRRELWVFLATADGYRALPPMPLELSVLSLDHGPPGLPVVALTDDGLSALRFSGDDTPSLELVPVLSHRPVLARTGTFVPGLDLTHDLDGDGHLDLLLPTVGGTAVYLGREGGFTPDPASRLVWPADDRGSHFGLQEHHPLPEIRDVDGDGRVDLLLAHHRERWNHFQVLLATGGGRFGEARAPLGPAAGAPPRLESLGTDGEAWPEIVHFGDLDGDGHAELVTRTDLGDDDAGFRQELREAKRPPFHYTFHRLGPDLSPIREPYLEFEARGYAFLDDDEIRVPGGFQDLDGDGRQDLLALTLDFSLFQAVRILTVKNISIGLDFHIWCQDAAGHFRAVEGLDLSGRFRLNLDNLELGRLAQFAGDFDGDGKADFVQMGRGREVGVHLGRTGCFYPSEPDLELRLEEEPRDLGLVQVRDHDGDGLTDLVVIQPGRPVAARASEPGGSSPVRLDLYLSGGGG